MKIVLVPNELRDEIHAAIDHALGGRPISDDERDIVYSQLLGFYDEHGVVPSFSLEPKEAA